MDKNKKYFPVMKKECSENIDKIDINIKERNSYSSVMKK